MRINSFRISKEFYDEMIEPVIKERGIVYSYMMIAIAKKLIKHKRLSSYAIDSELFKSKNQKKTEIAFSPSDVELFETFSRLFVPDVKSNKGRKAKSNIYLRDELYGLFYNYSDDRMIDLAREYGQSISNLNINNEDIDNLVFYMTAEDMEFLKMIKSYYDINRIVKKYLNIINSKSYNVYKDIVDSNGKFERGTNFERDKEKYIHHVRISLDIKIYKELCCEAHRYLIRSNSLMNACLQYVKSNLKDFDDCRVTKQDQETRYIGMRIYDETIQKYNIEDNSRVRELFLNIDINKLEKHVENNRLDFVPLDNTNHTRAGFWTQNISDEDFQRLTKIRKSYSVSWAEILRVALEKDLLKNKIKADK